jgi:hypothetical protein
VPHVRVLCLIVDFISAEAMALEPHGYQERFRVIPVVLQNRRGKPFVCYLTGVKLPHNETHWGLGIPYVGFSLAPNSSLADTGN